MPHRKISRLAFGLPLFGLASCVAPREVAAPPVAPPVVQVAPPPPVSADWRDWPLTPGRWTYANGAASFAAIGGAALFTMRCDAAARTVALSRPATAASAHTMTITTSEGVRALAAGGGAGAEAVLAARDPFLDRMAFSRGRIVVAVPGAARLVLPAWAEIGRVVEDCRG